MKHWLLSLHVSRHLCSTVWTLCLKCLTKWWVVYRPVMNKYSEPFFSLSVLLILVVYTESNLVLKSRRSSFILHWFVVSVHFCQAHLSFQFRASPQVPFLNSLQRRVQGQADIWVPIVGSWKARWAAAAWQTVTVWHVQEGRRRAGRSADGCRDPHVGERRRNTEALHVFVSGFVNKTALRWQPTGSSPRFGVS